MFTIVTLSVINIFEVLLYNMDAEYCIMKQYINCIDNTLKYIWNQRILFISIPASQP
jgi:hypothetical protein